LYDVIKILRFGTKLGAIKPFGSGKPSHHFASTASRPVTTPQTLRNAARASRL
jgi:hypothetical protein